MPEIDKVLEAEQAIQDIASELKRMRDAADLLENAQQSTAAIVESAGRVVEATQKFSASAGSILQRLSEIDLTSHLDSLHEEVRGVSSTVGHQIRDAVNSLASAQAKGVESTREEIRKAAAVTDQRIEQIMSRISVLEEKLVRLQAFVVAFTKERNKRDRIVSLVLAFLTGLLFVIMVAVFSLVAKR